MTSGGADLLSLPYRTGLTLSYTEFMILYLLCFIYPIAVAIRGEVLLARWIPLDHWYAGARRQLLAMCSCRESWLPSQVLLCKIHSLFDREPQEGVYDLVQAVTLF